MHLRKWNIKRISLIACICVFLYFALTGGYRKFEIDATITKTRPEDVWEYVADFSKMRLLNPTILDFKIIADSGHTHDWRYTVLYAEKLSHWPHWLNTAKADYVVTKSLPGVEPAIYAIQSKHQTCFFRGLYCLHSTSNFIFTARGQDTYCFEKVEYQCPPFLGHMCRRELEYQRKAVMYNLTTIFDKKQRTY